MVQTIIRSGLNKKLFLIYALNVADWICTVTLLHTGRFYEANPLMSRFVGDLPLSFAFKCLFPALIILAVMLALKVLGTSDLRIADRFISFVLVFYLAVALDHICNYLRLMIG